ncbi:MAG: hypothetical protein ACOYM3_13335 [Terrimicrobiaceae bacterium]
MRQSPVDFKRVLQVFLLVAGIAGAHAAEIQIGNLGVCLLAPPPWQEKSAEKEVSLVPPDEQQNKQKRRRLHLVLPLHPVASLEEEMYGDQALADEYDAIIMNGLRYENPN